MMHTLLFLARVLRWVEYAVLARVVASWIAPGSRHPAIVALNGVTEPLIKPFRVLVPAGGGAQLDLGPLLLLLALQLGEQLLIRLAVGAYVTFAF